MKGQYYRIDWDTCERLHLFGREAMVYCALIYLCKCAPYTGSASELADFARCGGYKTALRMLDKLQAKDLVVVEREDEKLKSISLTTHESDSQNDCCSSQNDYSSSQIGCFSKERSSKKENIIKEIKNKKACEYSVTAHAREDFMEIININQSPHYTYPDYYRVAIECGYLNPKPLADSFRDYYNDHGWPAGRDKLRMFRTWLNNEKRFETGRKPTLTEDERLILLTFVDKLPKRLMQHFSEQLRGLELTPEKIIFFVDKERYDNFRQWMIDVKAVEILAAYNRKVYVRPA